MNKIILVANSEIDTDLFNNQIFLDDTMRSESLASPVSQNTYKETEAKFDIMFAVIIIAIIILVAILAFILYKSKINNYTNTQDYETSDYKETKKYKEIEQKTYQEQKYKPVKKQTSKYATPTSLDEAIKLFLNITKIK